MREVTIIGSGLAGTLLALYLARRNYVLNLFDSRPDIRTRQTENGRSINLALSCRGITALERIGIMAEVKKLMVPMRARAVHELDGQINFQPFGRHQNEYINAVQRNDLNKVLLNELEKYPNVKLEFNTKLVDLDVGNKTAVFVAASGQIWKHRYKCIIGADGAGSSVREALKARSIIQATRSFLPYGYKELTICGPAQNHFSDEHLHIWPRDDFLLLGNPNLDKSITGSLFMPYEGKNSFATLGDELKVKNFFEKVFPDAYLEMPRLVEEFVKHPTGNMSTIMCDPWFYKDQCLLIGDAAHGVVPFFGQGMNCAFEDCRILNDLLDDYDDEWVQVMPAFFQARKRNTDAIAQMSMENFHEIESGIRNSRFNLRKHVEHMLMLRYPEHYVSKHVLVMFTNTPYVEGQKFEKLQTALLNRLCEHIETVEEMNWSNAEKEIELYKKGLAQLNLSFAQSPLSVS